MELKFRAISETTPGPKWKSLFDETWPAYRAWFLSEGDAKRPGYMTCQRNMKRHLPELVPMWKHLSELAGGGDHEARMLSLYRPAPYLAGCSQVVLNTGSPCLIRNYDYHPHRCEGVILLSCWHGTRVIATSDSLWGALDGINEHGLAAALAFGGRPEVGEGFGIPIIVRYLLEFCKTTEHAIEALVRIPSHMSYNVTLVDGGGHYATALLNPGRETRIIRRLWSTNHQDGPLWDEYEAVSQSRAREKALERSVAGPPGNSDDMVRRFMQQPLFLTNYARAFGTLYTAVLKPDDGRMSYYWKNREWHQSFSRFVEGVGVVRYES